MILLGASTTDGAPGLLKKFAQNFYLAAARQAFSHYGYLPQKNTARHKLDAKRKANLLFDFY